MAELVTLTFWSFVFFLGGSMLTKSVFGGIFISFVLSVGAWNLQSHYFGHLDPEEAISIAQEIATKRNVDLACIQSLLVQKTKDGKALHRSLISASAGTCKAQAKNAALSEEIQSLIEGVEKPLNA